MRRLALLASTFVFACSSGGGSSAPTLTPAQAELLYAQLNGSWNLVEDLSDDGSVALETGASPRRADRLGDRPETTSAAIRPTYQRAGETRNAMSGRLNRTAMRQTILLAGKRPSSVAINLTATGMEVAYDGGDSHMLPADGSRVTLRGDLMETRMRLVWESTLPIIEHEVENGGVIRDIFEAAPNGGTLWVTRQVIMGADAWQPAQFTFGR